MSSRILSIDTLRLPAAITIVWLHTVSSPHLQPTAVIGRFSVPFFTAASVFLLYLKFSSQKTLQTEYLKFIRKRIARLYIPFLLWSSFYWLVRYLNCRYFSECKLSPLSIDVFWTGTTHHLWFLPYMVFVLIGVFFLIKIFNYFRCTQWIIGILLLCGLYFSQRPLPFYVESLGYAPRLFLDALPAAFWTMAFSAMYKKNDTLVRFSTTIAYGSLLLFFVTMTILLGSGRNILVENISGVLLLLFAIYFPTQKAFALIAPYGNYAYGIYLVHIFFIEGFQDIFSKLLFSESWEMDILIFILSISFSIISYCLTKNTCLI